MKDLLNLKIQINKSNFWKKNKFQNKKVKFFDI